jgi:predicted short-subunit dehydrogenase-like oxidoreductase (DUF2520 family)
MDNSVKKIALAGSGNIAGHLAKGLLFKGYQITSIWSRELAHARTLANNCDSVACAKPDDLRAGADLIIITVPDNFIANVAQSIGEFDGIVVHTGASVSMEELKGHFEHFGVFYPLQTFTKDVPVLLGDVPFFLESSSVEVMKAIRQVAEKLSQHIYEVNSQQRLLLHVAAVFAGNYSNLMYVISNELLKNSGLPPEVLRPLILETARKASTGDPLKMQTGPARRNDESTIEKHIKALASLPEYAELYKLLAKQISQKYK